jgi:hypothetical protein
MTNCMRQWLSVRLPVAEADPLFEIVRSLLGTEIRAATSCEQLLTLFAAGLAPIPDQSPDEFADPVEPGEWALFTEFSFPRSLSSLVFFTRDEPRLFVKPEEAIVPHADTAQEVASKPVYAVLPLLRGCAEAKAANDLDFICDLLGSLLAVISQRRSVLNAERIDTWEDSKARLHSTYTTWRQDCFVHVGLPSIRRKDPASLFFATTRSNMEEWALSLRKRASALYDTCLTPLAIQCKGSVAQCVDACRWPAKT